MKRVVITGIGAVTPIGNDVENMWESMIAGRHGIAPMIMTALMWMCVHLASGMGTKYTEMGT